MSEVIGTQAVGFFRGADDGLDGGPPFELALDLRRDAALLAGGVTLELVVGRGVVAAIAGIGNAAIEHIADERFHLRNDRAKRLSLFHVLQLLWLSAPKWRAWSKCRTNGAMATGRHGLTINRPPPASRPNPAPP